ncbi:MAG: aminotransferase class V-fold PLP-dependent enzyme [Bacteroidales bacterium]|nr:aminotransferase class V-fold PLP-dependent enzyme [Bacteroidales bacterium]
MTRFDCDYMAGAHPEILKVINENNRIQTPGYGEDSFCDEARELIRKACGKPDAQVYFLVGGTQTNAAVLDCILPHTRGVLSTETGHINVHEAGAIEFSGHKVLSLPSHDGRMDSSELRDWIQKFNADDTRMHMVAPGAVYISFPTELGTVYSRDELESLYGVCREAGLPLFIDGARLGYGLAASFELDLKDIANLCDVFYIGGTKMGALFGEAVVCTRPDLMKDFFTLMKARGSVLAKGRLLGMQFARFFRDDLYLEIGKHGVKMALELRDILESKGFRTFIDSPTNQQFFVLPNKVADRLLREVSFEFWGPRTEEESQVRFVTSWETTQEDIDRLASLL